MKRIRRLTEAEFLSARRWAVKHPFTNPFSLKRRKEWAFVAANHQRRLEDSVLFR